MKHHTLVLLAVLVAAGCERGQAKHQGYDRAERLPRLEVVQPVRKRLGRKLEVAATVEALKKVDLAARIPGKVIDLDDTMDIGTVVKKDQVLCRLYAPELEADKAHKQSLLEQAKKQEKLAEAAQEVAEQEVAEARAEAKKYEADAEYNRLRHGRVQELVRQRAQDLALEQEARRQYESAQAAVAANLAKMVKLRAKVEAAKAERDLARQRIAVAGAELTKVVETIKLGLVEVPFDGVITRRAVDPGAVIKDAGTPLLTVMQLSRVRVLIDVPQRDASNLNSREQNPNKDGKGDPVTVRLPALGKVFKNGEVQGYVTRLSRSLDPVTRTMRAEVELENTPNLDLWPGMYGSASILVEDLSNVLTLPASALLRRGESLVEVYQVANPTGDLDERRGVLRRVPVVLGIDDGREVEIREGLSGDELIVLRATGVMRADEPVLAVPTREPVGAP